MTLTLAAHLLITCAISVFAGQDSVLQSRDYGSCFDLANCTGSDILLICSEPALTDLCNKTCGVCSSSTANVVSASAQTQTATFPASATTNDCHDVPPSGCASELDEKHLRLLCKDTHLSPLCNKSCDLCPMSTSVMTSTTSSHFPVVTSPVSIPISSTSESTTTATTTTTAPPLIINPSGPVAHVAPPHWAPWGLWTCNHVHGLNNMTFCMMRRERTCIAGSNDECSFENADTHNYEYKRCDMSICSGGDLQSSSLSTTTPTPSFTSPSQLPKMSSPLAFTPAPKTDSASTHHKTQHEKRKHARAGLSIVSLGSGQAPPSGQMHVVGVKRQSFGESCVDITYCLDLPDKVCLDNHVATYLCPRYCGFCTSTTAQTTTQMSASTIVMTSTTSSHSPVVTSPVSIPISSTPESTTTATTTTTEADRPVLWIGF